MKFQVMNKSKLNILVYLNKKSKNKYSKSVVMCKLTYILKRKQFSTGLFLNPSYWNTKFQQVDEES